MAPTQPNSHNSSPQSIPPTHQSPTFHLAFQDRTPGPLAVVHQGLVHPTNLASGLMLPSSDLQGQNCKGPPHPGASTSRHPSFRETSFRQRNSLPPAECSLRARSSGRAGTGSLSNGQSPGPAVGSGKDPEARPSWAEPKTHGGEGFAALHLSPESPGKFWSLLSHPGCTAT